MVLPGLVQLAGTQVEGEGLCFPSQNLLCLQSILKLRVQWLKVTL